MLMFTSVQRSGSFRGRRGLKLHSQQVRLADLGKEHQQHARQVRTARTGSDVHGRARNLLPRHEQVLFAPSVPAVYV